MPSYLAEKKVKHLETVWATNTNKRFVIIMVAKDQPHQSGLNVAR